MTTAVDGACGRSFARAALAITLIALTSASGRVHAADALPKRRLVFEVDGALAEVCPDEASFRKRVALRLGYDPFLAPDAGAATGVDALSVTVGGPRARPTAEVTLEDATGRRMGQRRLTTPNADCDELIADAAFAASLALDPTAAMRAPPDSEAARSPDAAPQAEAARPPERAPASEAPPEATRAEPRARVLPREGAARTAASNPWAARAKAGSGASFGALPGAAPVLTGGIEALRGHGSIEVGVRVDFPQSTRGGGATARASLVSAVVAACAHLDDASSRRTFVPFVCAAATLGALRGEAIGIVDAKRDVTPYIAVGPRVGARVALAAISDALSLEPRVEVPFVVTETQLEIDRRPVWSTPTAAVLVGLALAVRIR
jgi:hypothetical protein